MTPLSAIAIPSAQHRRIVRRGLGPPDHHSYRGWLHRKQPSQYGSPLRMW
jgi:hypothetical protein